MISLDEVCSTLGVERRRIYDIVNVLEAVEVVVKKGKNQYAWFGFSRLPSAIEKIEKFTLNLRHQVNGEAPVASV